MSTRRRTNGHQYAIGASVFLRPVAHIWISDPFEVIAHIDRNGWPHYLLRDPAGDQWQASQLELSSTATAWTDTQTFKRRREAINAAAALTEEAA
jgi:hypothetical protein